MPFDVAGNFTREYNFQQDRDNGIKILAARVDGEFDNFATGMNAVFFRDGRVPMQADLRMNINRITGIADGNVASPALKFQTDQSTGPYLAGLNQYAIAVNGVQRAVFSTTGLNVIGNLQQGGSQVAVLASPAFTGVPTAPTAAYGTNTTQIATTAFAQAMRNDTVLTGNTNITGAAAKSSGGAWTIDGAAGTERNLFWFSGGAYAASIGLLTDNGTLKHNAATAHRFDVSGAQMFGVNSTGAFVAGTTFYVNTNQLLMQHNGSHGYVRSATGNLNLGGGGTNVLELNSVNATLLTGGRFYGSPTGNYGFSHSRASSPGKAAFHLYNGGGVTEWDIYQPAGGTGHEFRIGTNVGGTITDRFILDSSGNITLGASGLRIGPNVGYVEYKSNAHVFQTYAGVALGQMGTNSGEPYMSINGKELGFRGLPSTSGGAFTPTDNLTRGGMYKATGNVTINNAIFAADDVLTVYNNSAASISIVQGAGVTMRLAGTATTGTRTLLQRGFATIVFISASECVVSGNVS